MKSGTQQLKRRKKVQLAAFSYQTEPIQSSTKGPEGSFSTSHNNKNNREKQTLTPMRKNGGLQRLASVKFKPHVNLHNSYPFLLQGQLGSTSVGYSLFIFKDRVYNILNRHRCAHTDVHHLVLSRRAGMNYAF